MKTRKALWHGYQGAPLEKWLRAAIDDGLIKERAIGPHHVLLQLPVGEEVYDGDWIIRRSDGSLIRWEAQCWHGKPGRGYDMFLYTAPTSHGYMLRETVYWLTTIPDAISDRWTPYNEDQARAWKRQEGIDT